MAWSFIKTDSIADFVAANYGKSLNFIKTDPITAIYRIGLTICRKQTLSQPAAKNEFAKLRALRALCAYVP